MKWPCWSPDIKTVILRNENIVKDVYTKLPKETECNVNILPKLNSSI